MERHSSQAFMPAKTKNSRVRRDKKQREDREVLLKDKGGQTTTEALDTKEGGTKWVRRTEVWRVK